KRTNEQKITCTIVQVSTTAGRDFASKAPGKPHGTRTLPPVCILSFLRGFPSCFAKPYGKDGKTQEPINPRCRAVWTASVRVVTWSFERIEVKWNLTVRSAMKS